MTSSAAALRAGPSRWPASATQGMAVSHQTVRTQALPMVLQRAGASEPVRVVARCCTRPSSTRRRPRPPTVRRRRPPFPRRSGPPSPTPARRRPGGRPCSSTKRAQGLRNEGRAEFRGEGARKGGLAGAFGTDQRDDPGADQGRIPGHFVRCPPGMDHGVDDRTPTARFASHGHRTAECRGLPLRCNPTRQLRPEEPPMNHAGPARLTGYTCPMHPRGRPGPPRRLPALRHAPRPRREQHRSWARAGPWAPSPRGCRPVTAPAATPAPCTREIVQDHPGDCPRCGMHLVPAGDAEHHHGHDHPETAADRQLGAGQYTCPMHPEIVRDKPGRCPICGMHLEPMVPTADDDTGRCGVPPDGAAVLDLGAAVAGAAAITVLGFPPLSAAVQPWVELAIATPVVLWCAGQFFVLVRRLGAPPRPNMWTLIGLGVGAAYLYSVVATVVPGIFPESLRDDDGMVRGVLRGGGGHLHPDPARPGAGAAGPGATTGSAIKGLLDLAPATARRITPDDSDEEVPLASIVVGDRVRVRPGRRSRRRRSSSPGSQRSTSRCSPGSRSPPTRGPATGSSAARSTPPAPWW